MMMVQWMYNTVINERNDMMMVQWMYNTVINERNDR